MAWTAEIRMDTAMSTSMGRSGRWTTFRAARASVMEWADGECRDDAEDMAKA